MPESRCTTHSVWKPNASFPTVAWPENPPSKYFSSASRTRALMRSRNASPSSMCLPDTRKDMEWPPLQSRTKRRAAPVPTSQLGTTRRSFNAMDCPDRLGRRELVPPALDRRRDAHGLPVFGHGAAGDIDTGFAQPLDDGVVG